MGDALLIGRVTDPTVLTNVEAVPVSADRLRLSGRITTDDVDVAKATRDQLVGMANNPDEPFVPLRWQKDPTLDQVVMPRSATVTMDPGSLERGWFPFDLEVDRVPGGALPALEAVCLGGFRSNSVGLTSGFVHPWHAVPEAALDYYDGGSGFTSSFVFSRTSYSGDLGICHFSTGVSKRVALYSLRPSDWYVGAARVEQTRPDGSYYTVAGRALYSGLSSTGWRITNDLVRVSPSATAGELLIECFDGTSWAGSKKVKITAYDGISTFTVNRINTIAVRRNAPEEVRVRLTVGVNSGGADYPIRITLDLSLRRGARHVEARMATFGTAVLGAVETDPVEAGTALTGGGYTSAGTTKLIMLSPANGTFDTVNSKLDCLGVGVRATAWSFGLGWQVAGAELASSVRDEYFGPVTETQTVVGW